MKIKTRTDFPISVIKLELSIRIFQENVFIFDIATNIFRKRVNVLVFDNFLSGELGFLKDN